MALALRCVLLKFLQNIMDELDALDDLENYIVEERKRLLESLDQEQD